MMLANKRKMIIDPLEKAWGAVDVFGFFEASDGEELPWYLQPLITFPAMFALVGVTLFAVLSLGGVTLEREVVDMDRELLSSIIEAAAAGGPGLS